MMTKVLKCNRCGFCQDVCPTYSVSKREYDVARGRIRLARLVTEGSYQWGTYQELEDHIKSCLLCKACVANCPSTVLTDQIMMEARAKINAAKGFSTFHKLVYRGMLSDQRKLRRISGLARFYQHSGARKLVQGTRILGIVKKLKRMEAILPDLPQKNFSQQAPAVLKTLVKPKYRIGYYVGCATNAFFSQVAVAVTKVLQHYGCQVYIPEIQCCGGPHQSAGDFEEARRLAKINIDKISELSVDYIVTDCATCGSTIKEYSSLLMNDHEYARKAIHVSSKLVDVNDFILNHFEISNLNPVNIKVSYHDPCHGIRGLKVSREPRRLLKLIPGLELTEMKQADWCCGGAGSYCFTNPQSSEKILDLKIMNFQKTGAGILATSCPACMMQLGYGLKNHAINARVLHPMQILLQAIEVNSNENK